MRKFFVVDRDGEYTGGGAEGDPGADRELQNDFILETNLVLLLSEITMHAEEITEIKDKEPANVLKILSDIINRVSEFSTGANVPGAGEGLLNLALAEASKNGSQVGLLHVDGDRLSAQTAMNLYKGWTGSPSDRDRMFRQIAQGMSGVLEFYFRSIHAAFVSPVVAGEWKEAFDICTKELTASLNSVKF